MQQNDEQLSKQRIQELNREELRDFYAKRIDTAIIISSNNEKLVLQRDLNTGRESIVAIESPSTHANITRNSATIDEQGTDEERERKQHKEWAHVSRFFNNEEEFHSSQ